MESDAPPPEARLFQMLTGKWVAQAIGAAARSGLAPLGDEDSRTSAARKEEFSERIR